MSIAEAAPPEPPAGAPHFPPPRAGVPALDASRLPPGAVPVPAPVPQPSDGAPYPVEQRVTGTELRQRNLDEPDDGPPQLFLETIPGEMVAGVSLPLPYRLSVSSTGPRVTLRLADSVPARAKGYTCVPFFKPISRCVGGRG